MKLKKLFVGVGLSVALTSSLMAKDLVKEGEKIFNTKKLGNCLACHDVNGKKIDNPGSLGPKLTGLKYYPDDYLYNAVYDIYKAKGIKDTAMPAFGRSGWLTDEQIKAVVAYLKTIE